MTYSRPGIRQVNVGAGSPRTNTPQVRLPRGSSVSANAPYRDNRSADQVFKNEMQKAEMTRDFLNFFTDTVQPQMAAAIDRNAQKEAQKVIDAFPPGTTASAGTPEQQDAYNSLSPRAKDFVIQSQAATAVAEYPQALQAEYTARPVLFAPGNTPEQNEQRAVAQAEAKAAARARVGLDKLPAYTVAQSSEALAKADGVQSGYAYKARMNKQSQVNQVNLMQAGGTSIAKGFRDLRVASASDVAGDQPQTVGMRQYLEKVVETIGLNYGGAVQAQILAGSLQRAIEQTTDVGERVELIRQLRLSSATPLNDASGKTDLFSFPLNEGGTSIKNVLEKLEEKTEAAADLEVLGEAALAFDAATTTEQREAIFAANADLLNNPANYAQLIRMRRTSEQEEVTQEMRENDLAMEQAFMEGEDPNILAKNMIAAEPGTHSLRAMERMAQRGADGDRAQSPLKPAIDEFDSAVYKQPEAFSTYFADYYQYVEKPKNESPRSGEKVTPTEMNARAAFRQSVLATYIEKWQNREPKSWNPREALIESMEEVAGKAREEAVGTGAPALSPQKMYTTYWNTATKALSNAAAASGGRITEDNIPKQAIDPAVYGAFVAGGKKSFDNLAGSEKRKLLIQSVQGYQVFDKTTGTYRKYTADEAIEKVKQMMSAADERAALRPAGSQSRVPETVPVKPPTDDTRQFVSPAQKAATEVLESAVEYLQKDSQRDTNIPALEGIKSWFNNGGLGPQAMSYVNGFLNLVTGAAPANAQELAYGTPEGLQALRRSWESGQQGLSTPPLPQVPASTPVRPVPTAITNDQHELFVMVGVAEGTRTASGGYTKAYYGHTDPGDGNYNRGTVSGGRGSNMSPAMVDRRWMGILTGVQQRMRPYLIVYGLQPGTQGYNRVMFNLIDLEVQSPAAARDFAGKLPQMKAAGWTVEAIAKARADSYINPETGRLEASGFGNSYQRLMKDQRSRAGVYDYRRRM